MIFHTAIKTGKASLKGATLQPDLVAEWVDAFPLTFMVTDLMNSMYDEEEDENAATSTSTKHKEEMHSRRDLDKKDRDLILEEFLKHDHPLEDQRPYLFNPTNGRRAPPQVNVHNSREIGEKLVNEFRNKLPKGFHDTLSTPIVTMAATSAPKCKNKQVVLSLETMCLNILTVEC